jgi:hypothetical protein
MEEYMEYNNQLPVSVTQAIPKLEVLTPKYQHVYTPDVLDVLQSNGWGIVNAKAIKVRDSVRLPFAKHLVELEHPEYSLLDNGDKIRAQVLNSHAGQSPVILRFGILVLVCTNGLVVSKGTCQEYSIRHIGFTKDHVQAALTQMLTAIPSVNNTVNLMRSTELTPVEALQFACEAARMRYIENVPINPSELLTIRRNDDATNSLWHTFNRVQENMLKGGMNILGTTKRRSTTRLVTGINEQTRLNKGLWDLAVKYIPSVINQAA